MDGIRNLQVYIDIMESGNVLLPSAIEEETINGGDKVDVPALMAPIATNEDGEMSLFAGNEQNPEEIML